MDMDLQVFGDLEGTTHDEMYSLQVVNLALCIWAKINTLEKTKEGTGQMLLGVSHTVFAEDLGMVEGMRWHDSYREGNKAGVLYE